MKKIEEVQQPHVGEFYLVPHVDMYTALSGVRSKGPIPMPIIGPWHEDHDIGISEFHFHYDIRFLASRHFEESRAHYLGRVHSAFTSHPTTDKTACDMLKPPLITYRRRKMIREMPDFPGPSTASFIYKLETRFLDHKLTCNVCPHKGMPLGQLRQDERGRVICNGHGLRWNLRTGRLSIRNEQ